MNAGENPTVTLKIQDKTVAMTVAGNKARYTPTANLPDGRLELEVNVTRSDGIKSAPFKWAFFIGESIFRHYRGQIHSTPTSPMVQVPYMMLTHMHQMRSI